MHRLVKTLILFVVIASCNSSYSQNPSSIPEGYPIRRDIGVQNNPSNLMRAFQGNVAKYSYFSNSVSHIYTGRSSDNYLYENIDPMFPVSQNFNDLSLFKRIKDTSGLDELGDNNRSPENIDKFLKQDYRSQVLPDKAYAAGDIPKPLYVSDLKRSTFEAVANGDLDSLRALLDNYNLLNIKDEEGFNLLLHSILHNQYDVAAFLIKRGIKLNDVNKYGASALIIAARNNNMKMIKLLTSMKIKINIKDRFGNTALDYALINKNKEMYEYLLSLVGNRSTKK